ncbi:hypothetical protein THRCLA_06795 [Thraustotheca clavata]|uniref:MSP domain-containing protein n=1 Tax=Thraustotheca clavata TaxID=74557 RepID=A0A1V9ZJ97_9STRA|nr:hypothetical protein THRCLA_06795 [Thraustotheca clavata]
MTKEELTSLQAIELSSDALVFKLEPGKAPVVTWTLKNPSSTAYISFKIKPTRPARYLVEPNHGVVTPSSAVAITVTMQEKDCDQLLRLDASQREFVKDKLHVLSVGVDAAFCVELKGAQDAAEELVKFWASVDRKHISNHNLRCTFEEDGIVSLSRRNSTGSRPPRLDSICSSSFTEANVSSSGSTISFVLQQDDAPHVTIVMTNPSNEDNLTFQITSSQPKRYHVRPNHGVLGPNGRVTVHVIMTEKYCEKVLKLGPAQRTVLRDRLVVQCIGLRPDFCRKLTKKASKEVIDDLTTLWTRTEKKRIWTKKLRCYFVEDDEASTCWTLALAPTMELKSLQVPKESTPEETTMVVATRDARLEAKMRDQNKLKEELGMLLQYVVELYA